MKTLVEELWAVVKEYTRQVAELLGASEWHWVGTDDGKCFGDAEAHAQPQMAELSVCDFGDTWFLTLEEMQVIVDGMERWVQRYGSREAVAQEVKDWFEWWLSPGGREESPTPDPSPVGRGEGTRGEVRGTVVELYEERRHRYLRTLPKINLKSWLMGCPRDLAEKREAPSVDEELRVLVAQRELIGELAEKYRDTRSLWNVAMNLDAEIKELRKRKEKRDAELLAKMKQSDAYKELRELQDRAIEEAF